MRTYALPQFSAADAAALARDLFGLDGSPTPLPGERDLNFRIDGETPAVLKIAGSHEDGAVLELQQAALAHLTAARPSVELPRPLPLRNGDFLTQIPGPDGADHFVRALQWVSGVPFADVRPHSSSLLQSLGESLGALDRGLTGFAHPAAQRTLKWDLAQASWALAETGEIEDPKRRAVVERVLGSFVDQILPRLSTLRRGVIHGDANDYNILTRCDERDQPRVVGFVDFGDMVESYVICDLAIAIAYAMLHKPDPLSAAVDVVSGYHRAFPLLEEEMALVLPLARTRLAVSVVNAAIQARAFPGNDYLQISAAPAWALLDRLAGIDDHYAECRVRDACGLEPCAKSPRVRRWLAEHRGEFAPVVPMPLDATNVPVLDLSVTSAELGTTDEWQSVERFTTRLFSQLRDSGAPAAIGRYDEVRALYTSDVFRVEGNDGPEFRSVHIGLDVFVPPGTPVYTPIAGRVHSLRDNANPLDYGPTVIVEHTVDDGRLTFWTLYGHLSRESLGSLRQGMEFAAGDQVGTTGDVHENGGWPPHPHVQIICDLFGKEGDFPGVARPRERAVWLSVSPDPSLLVRLPDAARAPQGPAVDDLLARRRAHLGPSLSISYKRPLHIVRGVGQYLIAADGRRYLDAVNNVAHVGHSHPDVVRAAVRQMAVLNTNTRYLHESLLEYAERLTATLPDPLKVCFFVCSGSEANELAIRMARAHTGERDMIVVDAGYHGNTSTLVEVSPYKFKGPGGSGQPSWVQVAPMPDVYRGPFREDDLRAGWKYAQGVREAVAAIRRNGARPAAFLCESILSCGGQIVLPKGYLPEAYRHVRGAGGVCIADEVQVGFGRVGTHMWAFETQGVVPDIVTMGKPIGNGHPLGAVVTTPEIAASFANGMEYFNTFGGNPVSCEVGLAVLDVMAREGLQAHALDSGNYLMDALRTLLPTHPLIGDVRGLGLFVGVELVTDREARTPATRQASYVANRMKDRGVLMSTDGPFNNVLKIKPPLCFTRADADQLVETMDVVMREIGNGE